MKLSIETQKGFDLIIVWAPAFSTWSHRSDLVGTKQTNCGLRQWWRHHLVMSRNICTAKVQAGTNSETDKGSRLWNNSSHTRSIRREKYLEKCTKEFIQFISIVPLTFLGRSVFPIWAGNCSLGWGPWCNPFSSKYHCLFLSVQQNI